MPRELWAAKALFALMDSDGFDLDLDAIDRLNEPTTSTRRLRWPGKRATAR